MEGIKRFIAAIDVANEKAGNAVLYLIPLLVLLVTYEVVARYIFNSPTTWGFETSEFMFCAAIALGGGYALLHGRHVNVDIITQRLKTKTRAILNLCTLPLVVGFVGVLLYLCVQATIDSYRYMETASGFWQPVLFPIYTLTLIGVALTFLQAIAEFLRNLTSVITGKELKSRFEATAK